MNKLEKHYRDMQDVEFTIENGKLFMLQTRSGKRTAKAALKIAVDLVNEKMLTEKEALMKIDPKQLDSLLHPQFDEEALEKAEIIGSALPASPGAASGVIAFTAEKAIEFNKNKKKVILVRLETSQKIFKEWRRGRNFDCSWWNDNSRCGCSREWERPACRIQLIIDNKTSNLL